MTPNRDGKGLETKMDFKSTKILSVNGLALALSSCLPSLLLLAYPNIGFGSDCVTFGTRLQSLEQRIGRINTRQCGSSSSASCTSAKMRSGLLWQWLAACLLALLSTTTLARGIVLEADSHLTDDALLLSGKARVALDADVIDALDNGITLHFVLEARVARSHRYWVDKGLAETRRVFAVARHALSNRYSVVEIGRAHV